MFSLCGDLHFYVLTWMILVRGLIDLVRKTALQWSVLGWCTMFLFVLKLCCCNYRLWYIALQIHLYSVNFLFDITLYIIANIAQTS